jgi:hypothetical protein
MASIPRPCPVCGVLFRPRRLAQCYCSKPCYAKARQHDQTGRRYGRLVVTGEAQVRRHGRPTWECLCDCGTTRTAEAEELRTGHVQSCGCLALETRGANNRTHGQSKTDLWKLWVSMRQRCENPANPSYARYGALGVKVCTRWQEFLNFLEDMGERPTASHSIDRKDPHGDYCPENCRWATPTEQANNRRKTVLWECDGLRLSVAQWAARTGMKQATLRRRLKAGWPIKAALTMPVEPSGR